MIFMTTHMKRPETIFLPYLSSVTKSKIPIDFSLIGLTLPALFLYLLPAPIPR